MWRPSQNSCNPHEANGDVRVIWYRAPRAGAAVGNSGALQWVSKDSTLKQINQQNCQNRPIHTEKELMVASEEGPGGKGKMGGKE